MRFSLRQRPLRAAVSVSALALGGVLVFQNCSDNMQPLDQASLASTYPFAFDGNADTFAYMSCTQASKGPNSPLFTYRVGGYSPLGGVRLSDGFLAKTASWNAIQRQTVLREAFHNTDVYMQFSFRDRSSLGILSPQGGQPVRDNFLGPLDDTSIFTPISNANGGLAQSFSGTSYVDGADRPRRVQGSLFFGAAKSAEMDRFNNLQGRLFALNFVKGADGTEALGSSPGISNFIAGRGYEFTYAGSEVTGETTPAPRVLASVRETYLSSRTETGANWSCRGDLRFRIYSACNLGCGCNDDGQLSGAAKWRMDVVRRVLPADQWYVDLNNSCVVQRPTTYSTACYASGEQPGTNSWPYHWVSICGRFQ